MDDSPKEGLPIVRAFWKNGILAGYFTAKDDFPLKPLSGVRLLVLDLHLTDGDPTSNENTISSTIGLIPRILSPTNGPYQIALWSNKPELVSLFKERMKELPTETLEMKIPRPFSIIDLDKSNFISTNDFLFDEFITSLQSTGSNELKNEELAQVIYDEMTRSENDLVNAISDRLDKDNERHESFVLLVDWENRVLNAAQQSLSTLMELSEVAARTDCYNKEESDYLKRIDTVAAGMLTSLMQESTNLKLADNSTVLKSLQSTLNLFLFDRIESSWDGLAKLERGISHLNGVDLRDELHKSLRRFYSGRINKALLIDNNPSTRSVYYPGNVYEYNEVAKLIGAPDVSAFVSNTFSAKREKQDEIGDAGISCFIEISSLCDFINNKIQYCTFIMGHIVPTEFLSHIKRGISYGHVVGPFNDTESGDDKCIVINSHFVFSTHIKDTNNLKSLLRIRKNTLALIQNWYHNHTSRPGDLCLNRARIRPPKDFSEDSDISEIEESLAPAGKLSRLRKYLSRK